MKSLYKFKLHFKNELESTINPFQRVNAESYLSYKVCISYKNYFLLIWRLERASLNTSCWISNSLPLLAHIFSILRALILASALHKLLMMTDCFLYYAIRFIYFLWLHCLVDFLKLILYYLLLLRMLAVDTALELDVD